MSYVVYKHYSKDDVLLYVGCTINIFVRTLQHKNKSWFKDIEKITLKHFDDKGEALFYEKHCQNTENPMNGADQYEALRNTLNDKYSALYAKINDTWQSYQDLSENGLYTEYYFNRLIKDDLIKVKNAKGNNVEKQYKRS